MFRAEQGELSTDSGRWLAEIRPVILNTMQSGGLVIMPTETSYMLGGDARNPLTMSRLRRLKKRPDHQDISVMFGSRDEAEKWTVWNDIAYIMADRYLPGPLTLILPLRDGMVQFASVGNTLGIRIPGHPFLLDLLRLVDFPVTATSANPHGTAEPYSIDACVSPVDVVWDAGPLIPSPPSTIIDLSKGKASVIRQGTIRMDDLI